MTIILPNLDKKWDISLISHHMSDLEYTFIFWSKMIKLTLSMAHIYPQGGDTGLPYFEKWAFFYCNTRLSFLLLVLIVWGPLEGTGQVVLIQYTVKRLWASF